MSLLRFAVDSQYRDFQIPDPYRYRALPGILARLMIRKREMLFSISSLLILPPFDLFRLCMPCGETAVPSSGIIQFEPGKGHNVKG
jgi:hypothetical protein